MVRAPAPLALLLALAGWSACGKVARLQNTDPDSIAATPAPVELQPVSSLDASVRIGS